jgi:hypothetical protein
VTAGFAVKVGALSEFPAHRPPLNQKTRRKLLSNEHRVVKPHFINPCCFGEDFAGWLKQQLTHSADLGVGLSEPIQEDYGWGVWVTRGKDRFWVARSYVGGGPQEAPAQWIISVKYDPGLNIAKRLFHKPDEKVFEQLRDRIRRIIASNSTIKMIES